MSVYCPDYSRIIYKIKVTHKIKDKYGNITEPKNVKPTIIYVPKGDTYKIKNIGKINGGGYISNSLNSQEITADDFNKEVDFYYRPESEEKKTVSALSADGKNIVIKPQNIPTGFKITAAFYKENKMMSVKVFNFDESGVLCPVPKEWDKAKIMVFGNLNSLMPECEPEKLNLSDLIN